MDWYRRTYHLVEANEYSILGKKQKAMKEDLLEQYAMFDCISVVFQCMMGHKTNQQCYKSSTSVVSV